MPTERADPRGVGPSCAGDSESLSTSGCRATVPAARVLAGPPSRLGCAVSQPFFSLQLDECFLAPFFPLFLQSSDILIDRLT